MKQAIYLSVGVLISFIVLYGCGDETTIINSSSKTVWVSGKVYGWYCMLHGGPNYGSPDHRYTVTTGIPAKIKFIHLSGLAYGGYTDDSSAYHWQLDPGPYIIVLETPHAHPDTVYNVALHKDTTIDLDLVYEYLTADTVNIDFFYTVPAESLGYAQEWQYIQQFNQDCHYWLNPLGMKRNIETFSTPWIIVNYRVPTVAGVAPWQVNDIVNEMRPLTGYGFPGTMGVFPDPYICLDKK